MKGIRIALLLLSLPVLLLPVLAPAAEAFDEGAYKGKVVYLDFWASWCVPCRKSFPWLNELAKKYPGDLVVVGINVDNERASADRFLAKFPANFPLVFDPKGQVAARYRLEGMPSSVILDRDGKEIHRHVGFRDDRVPEYELLVRKLIERK